MNIDRKNCSRKNIRTARGMFSSPVTHCSQGSLIVVCDNFRAIRACGSSIDGIYFTIGQTVRFIGIQDNDNFADGSVKLVRFEHLELEYIAPINCFTTEEHWARMANAIISEEKRMSSMKRKN